MPAPYEYPIPGGSTANPIGPMPPSFNLNDVTWHEIMRQRGALDAANADYNYMAPYLFNKMEDYGQQGDEAWARAQGYSDEEIARMRDPSLMGKQLSPDEYNARFLGGDEQRGIQGDPYSAMAWLNPESLQGYADASQQSQGKAVDAAQGEVLGNINPDWFRIDPNFQGSQEGTIGRLESESGQAFIDPSRLRLSEGFAENYPLSDEEVSAHGELAGRAASTRYQADMDEMQRRADASGGTSSLAMGALGGRMRREGAIAGADAMSSARLGALAAQREQQRQAEQMRLLAEQGLTDREIAALMGDRSALGASLGARSDIERMRLGGAGEYSNLAQRGGMYLGDLRTGVSRDVANRGIDVGKYVTNTGSDLTRWGEDAASRRAGELALNRQNTERDTSQEKYARDKDIGQTTYDRYRAGADERLADERGRRDYYGGQQDRYGGLYEGERDNRTKREAVLTQAEQDAQATNAGIKRSGLRNRIVGSLFDTASNAASAFLP